ncbi:MAG: gliding motility-associated C-terminal domain-containing protein [Bacteroidota bacterium]
MRSITLLLIASYCFFPVSLFAQFVVNGNATNDGGGCYTLTQNFPAQSGSVWFNSQIDLSQEFVFSARIFLGCNNFGADGMTFCLQPISTNVGTTGGGLGYQGIFPSLAVEFDTYQNGNFGDPAFDHMALISNGSVDHTAPTNLAGPVGISPANANVEDCQYHDLHIDWDPVDDSLKVYVDCNLRIAYAGDIVTTIFSGNPNVFWGFTAGTGALFNQQGFCYEFVSFGLDTTVCQGDSIPLSVTGGTSYAWSPTAGLSDPSSADPMAAPATSTVYTASITDSCGFVREETFTINIIDTLMDVNLGIDSFLCDGTLIDLDAYQVGSGATYLWQNGSTDSVITVSTSGLYWVEVSNLCAAKRDSIQFAALSTPAPELGNDTIICQGNSLNLDITNIAYQSYLWQDGSTTGQFVSSSPGLIWVEATNICGIGRDSLLLTVESPLSQPNLGNDTLLCDGASLFLDAQIIGADYLWQNGSINSNQIASGAGIYWVEVSNLCSVWRDSIEIGTDVIPDINLGSDTDICQGQNFVLDASSTASATYLWHDGLTNPSRSITQSGTYSVLVTNACGTDQDAVQITVNQPPPPVDLGADQDLCNGQQAQLSTGLSNDITHLWSNGSGGTSLTVNRAGEYWVVLTNQCGLTTDTVVYQYFDPPQVDLGPDETICTGQSLAVDVSWPGATYRWDDGSASPQRNLTEAGRYQVEVINQCGEATDAIQLFVTSGPMPVDLGADLQVCKGDTLLLDAFQGDFDYLWNDRIEGPQLLVTREGTFEVAVSNECGTVRDAVFIDYLAAPAPNLGLDTVICIDRDRPILLDASFNHPVSYQWQDGSSDDQFLVTEPGLYAVLMENNCGMGMDSIQIDGAPCFCAIHAPTGFTPNADGLNENWSLQFVCEIQSGQVSIVNRWGQVVFQSEDPSASWDGTYQGQPCPEGVYVWRFSYDYQEANRTETWVDQGTVTLIR